jgi:hypothetical protein
MDQHGNVISVEERWAFRADTYAYGAGVTGDGIDRRT